MRKHEDTLKAAMEISDGSKEGYELVRKAGITATDYMIEHAGTITGQTGTQDKIDLARDNIIQIGMADAMMTKIMPVYVEQITQVEKLSKKNGEDEVSAFAAAKYTADVWLGRVLTEISNSLNKR